MKRLSVYDLPTRVFHWLFAGLFLTAFVIAKTIDDDSGVFPFHMLAGMTLSFLVTLRVIWGLVGTKHARFSGFALNPKDLIAYLKGVVSGDKRRWAGHNPASSWAAITMMALAIGLGITGYLMTSGSDKDTFKEVHEILANGFIIVVIFHIAGIAVHTLRHKEMIGLSMVDGKKADVRVEDIIPSSKTAIGIFLLALVAGFAINLFNHYDSQTRTLKIFGSTLMLGENESSEEESH